MWPMRTLSRVEGGVRTHTGGFSSNFSELNNVQDVDGMFIDRETNDL